MTPPILPFTRHQSENNINSLRVLSLKQPWLHAILHFGKDCENRTWNYEDHWVFRGYWICLHASAALSKQEYELARYCYPNHPWPKYSPKDRDGLFHLGTIQAIAQLGDQWVPNSPWADRRQRNWQLLHMYRLPMPIPAKGALRFWYMDAELKARVLDQLFPTEDTSATD